MRRKIFYRLLDKTNNNLYKYQFYGVSAEDLALYLYKLGIEKENIYQYRDIANHKKFNKCKRRKQIFKYNYNISTIKHGNDVMFITNDNNSKIFNLSIVDIFDSEEFYDVKLFAYFHDYDWQLILFVDNELFVKYFVNYLKRKTLVTLTEEDEIFQ